MVAIGSLWLAILLSALFVWIVSAIVWMVLPHHRSDYAELPDEETFRSAVGPQNLSPGAYNIPNIASRKDLERPEVRERFERGPMGFLYIVPPGIPSMRKNLLRWSIFLVAVSSVVAYVTTRTLQPGAEYLHVFQISGTVAWLAYGVAYVQDGIFFGRPWSQVWKFLLDAFLYGLVTGGVFGWLWPA